MATTHIPPRKKFMDAYNGCMEMKVTERPDYSDLEPYFKMWEGNTKNEFKKTMEEIEEKISSDREELKKIIKRLLEHAQKMWNLDKRGYKS